MYPPELVKPMRAELTNAGFTELSTPEAVENAINNLKGTALLVVNSVCGCAAGAARPAVLNSIQHVNKPEYLWTVFAGVDQNATKRAREFLLPYPPSSPAIALFKDGELVHIIERHHIEGRSADMIAQNLKLAYDQFCQKVSVN